ncbi:MAG: endopeptidase La [Alphaproteobacteria bacterium]|nr:endopeptidase La [Alphaproteobacteria bacterium]MCB9692587.1 endopeptidase La [Alphaproteobacteria bacterium]
MYLALPVSDVVLFPGMFRVAHVKAGVGVRAVDKVAENPEPLVCLHQLRPGEEDPKRAEYPDLGVICQVLRVIDMPDGSLRVLLEGLERAALTGKPTVKAGTLRVQAKPLNVRPKDPVRFEAVARELDLRYRDFMIGTGVSQSDHAVMGSHSEEPERLADQVLANLDLTYEERLHGLLIRDPLARLEHALEQVAVALGQQAVAREVNDRMQATMDRSQREYQLKEQLKAIRSELGEAVGSEAEADAFEARIHESRMPDEVREESLKEVGRLRRIHSDSAEYTVLRSWLETVCDIPWGKYSDDTTDLPAAKAVLDGDHHGLDEVKERVLEYLAVRELNPDSKGPVLCFVGPPGVGKTSLGRSIATALGRSFGRFALGGVKDETEIRGHRRTYIGAMAGRLVRTLIRTGTANPVIVLDELDKVGNDFRGDPASALLEVLDPEQNHAFLDHYVDLPVDLSKVLFIGTANLQDPIPAALRDRLEIIEIPGYTEEEKVEIADRFLLPNLRKSHGLTEKQIKIDRDTLTQVVRDYTREAGVRHLERKLGALHRKVARKVVEKEAKSVKVTPKKLGELLGPPVYHPELAERVDQPGIAIGLAWTAVGGEILFIEATKMPGKRSMKLTGSLGDVMKESAEAAMSWLRTNAAAYGIEPEAFEHEFHLHVPAGAIPKDGPSAGVVMVAALASIVTGRRFRTRWAMTGEITLRGRVLPIGGVKEKALAARRAGVTDIVLPVFNRRDLEDIAPELREGLTFHYVETVDEVLSLALEPMQ